MRRLLFTHYICMATETETMAILDEGHVQRKKDIYKGLLLHIFQLFSE